MDRSYNGRPAVTFRYPINLCPSDNALPTIDPAQSLPGVKLRFKQAITDACKFGIRW